MKWIVEEDISSQLTVHRVKPSFPSSSLSRHTRHRDRFIFYRSSIRSRLISTFLLQSQSLLDTDTAFDLPTADNIDDNCLLVFSFLRRRSRVYFRSVSVSLSRVWSCSCCPDSRTCSCSSSLYLSGHFSSQLHGMKKQVILQLSNPHSHRIIIGLAVISPGTTGFSSSSCLPCIIMA